jgi:hypothetical protein
MRRKVFQLLSTVHTRKGQRNHTQTIAGGFYTRHIQVQFVFLGAMQCSQQLHLGVTTV